MYPFRSIPASSVIIRNETMPSGGGGVRSMDARQEMIDRRIEKCNDDERNKLPRERERRHFVGILSWRVNSLTYIPNELCTSDNSSVDLQKTFVFFLCGTDEYYLTP